MGDCRVGGMVDEIAGLLSDLSDREPSERARVRLTELLDRWDRETCPNDGCVRGRCPFRRTEPWIELRGFVDLYDLIMHLDQREPIDRLPEMRGIDALDAHWARRPGHYNP